MKILLQSGHKLRLPLIGLGLTLIFASLLYYASTIHMEKAEQALQSQNHLLKQVHELYQTSSQEKAKINQYLQIYQKLTERGFIGEGRRQDWIDNLRKISIHYQFFNIHYDVGMVENYKPALSVDTGNFKLNRTSMKLTFPMLHEGDLLILLHALLQERNPPFMLRNCTLSKIKESGSGEFLPKLYSTCEIDWITLTPASNDASISP